MKPRTILTLDHMLGKPLCAVCSLVVGLHRLIRRDPGKSRRILFVKLIEMGSTVLAVPAFEEAARQVGRKNIFVLVFDENRPIVDLIDCFPSENIITIDAQRFNSFAYGLARALVRIRRERIDTAIDMEGLTRASALITYLTGARIRVGYHNFTAEGPYRGRLFTHELNYTFQHHISRSFLALVHALHTPAGHVPRVKHSVEALPLAIPQFTPTETDRRETLALLEPSHGNPDRSRILLNPNCSELLPLRRWPTEHFIELGRRLVAEFPHASLIITGATGEREEGKHIAAAIEPSNRVLSLAGQTSLRQLLTLYTLSDLLITNDSGPAHFAALTPIRVIALFGPETPLLYGPLGARAVTITADLACSPCVNLLNHRFSPCRDNVCMQAITVEQVYQAAVAKLTERSTR